MPKAKEAQALCAQWTAKATTDSVEPGMGGRFCARCDCGRGPVRVFSVVDAYTRECLALEVDTGFASRRVTRVLNEVIAQRGKPVTIRCDNGPELTSRHFLAWAMEWKIDLRHIQPDKPTQNAHVESFHARLREECLRTNWFINLFDARRKITSWRKEYNEERPHSSLGYRTPAEFAQACGVQSYGKEADFVCLENAGAFSHFPTTPVAAAALT